MLMIWRMLKDIHCSPSISAFLAVVIAICFGFIQAILLGSKWFFEVFDNPMWILVIIGVHFCCLLIIVFIRIMKIRKS